MIGWLAVWPAAPSQHNSIMLCALCQCAVSRTYYTLYGRQVRQRRRTCGTNCNRGVEESAPVISTEQIAYLRENSHTELSDHWIEGNCYGSPAVLQHDNSSIHAPNTILMTLSEEKCSSWRLMSDGVSSVLTW
jgi:hypothetical protein